MDPRFFRKYADLIESAEKDMPMRLDEGVVDTVVQYAQKLVQKASPGLMDKVTDLVSNALGKPIEQITMADLTLDNAKKVLAANKQMSEAEEYQNPRYNHGDAGYETADIPDTLEKNQKADTIIGGVVGMFAGSLIAAAIPGLMTVGLPILGLAVIAGAVIGYKSATPDRGATGRFKNRAGDIEDIRNWSLERKALGDPDPRDPRFDKKQ